MMNMVIHDLRNPAALIDANLDSLADLIGITVNNLGSEVTPKNNITGGYTARLYKSNAKKSKN